jgi:hypothetical protein
VSAFSGLSPISTQAVENLVGKSRVFPGKPRPHIDLTHFEQLFVQSRQLISSQQVEKTFQSREGVFVESTSRARAEISTAAERVRPEGHGRLVVKP